MKIDTATYDQSIVQELNIDPLKVKPYGQVRRAHVQRDNRIRLVTTLTPVQVVAPATNYACQWAWEFTGLVPLLKGFGTKSRGTFSAQFTLLICSDQPECFDAFLNVLTRLDAQIRQISSDTLHVLRTGWEMGVGQEKNYHPAWWSWMIRGDLRNVILSDC